MQWVVQMPDVMQWAVADMSGNDGALPHQIGSLTETLETVAAMSGNGGALQLAACRLSDKTRSHL